MKQLTIKGSPVWTSRYCNPVLADDKYIKVGISLGDPKYELPYKMDDKIYSLAPSRAYMRSEKQEFIAQYTQDLEAVGIDRILERLFSLGIEGREIVLLCFEDVSKDFCHRTVLADWIYSKIGAKPLELASPSEIKQAKIKTLWSKEQLNKIKQKGL